MVIAAELPLATTVCRRDRQQGGEIKIYPVAPALGAEVIDLDASRAIAPDELRELQAAYLEHHLLLLRDQHLTQEQQERFVSSFGPLIDEGGDQQVSGLLSNVIEDAAGSGPLPFHSDFTFTPTPAQGIALYALELPREGTSTFFANGVRAAATLPKELRVQVEERTATHALAFFITGDEGARTRDHVLSERVPRHEHPVLRHHPRTGKEVLFITDLHVERINGLEESESRSLVEALLAHLYRPDNTYEHRWSLGDLIVWDNEALQHSRPDVTLAKPRTFRRNSLNTARWVEMIGSYT